MFKLNKIVKPFCLLIILEFYFQCNVFSQERPPLITDRPDQRESSSVVPWKALQIESGLLLANNKEQDYNIVEFSYPSILVRYGLWKKIEFRMSGGFATIKQIFDKSSESKTEIGNLSLGFKISLMQENGILPEIGLPGHLSFPLSSDTLVKNKIRPNMIFSFSHSLS